MKISKYLDYNFDSIVREMNINGWTYEDLANSLNQKLGTDTNSKYIKKYFYQRKKNGSPNLNKKLNKEDVPMEVEQKTIQSAATIVAEIKDSEVSKNLSGSIEPLLDSTNKTESSASSEVVEIKKVDTRSDIEKSNEIIKAKHQKNAKGIFNNNDYDFSDNN